MNCIRCHRPEEEHFGSHKYCVEGGYGGERCTLPETKSTSTSFARQDREDGWQLAERLAEALEAAVIPMEAAGIAFADLLAPDLKAGIERARTLAIPAIRGYRKAKEAR